LGIFSQSLLQSGQHTFAITVTLNNGIPIESVSKMPGHSSVKMTEIYAKLLDDKVENDMARIFGKYSAK
jgi:site-specific recombinase XerD